MIFRLLDPISAVEFDLTGKYLLTAGDKHIHVFNNVAGTFNSIPPIITLSLSNFHNLTFAQRLQVNHLRPWKSVSTGDVTRAQTTIEGPDNRSQVRKQNVFPFEFFHKFSTLLFQVGINRFGFLIRTGDKFGDVQRLVIKILIFPWHSAFDRRTILRTWLSVTMQKPVSYVWVYQVL